MQTPDELLKQINRITIDSRQVQAGCLFCAYPGEKVDGRSFIEQAIAQGAIAIAYEPRHFDDELRLKAIAAQANVIFTPINDLQKKVSQFVAQFHQPELEKLALIGVTGTNGKTSVTHYLGQAWCQLGVPCGVLGTVGYGVYQPQQPLALASLNLTTPDPVTLIECLLAMQQQTAQKVAMEVSAHALTQGRVTGLSYKTAVFTNLTQDHLDYYGTMEKYGQAKAALFAWPNLTNAIVNSDDPFADTIIAQLHPDTFLVVFGLNQPTTTLSKNYVFAQEIVCTDAGYRCVIDSSWGTGTINSTLIGRFNISNLLACLAVLLAEGVEFEQAMASVAQLQPVPGRMQVFGGGEKPRVIVDYAHTPDALEKALLAAREHLNPSPTKLRPSDSLLPLGEGACRADEVQILTTGIRGRLYCVFGCGGDRDPLKRPMMAQVAEKYADKIIITQDNPRTESWQRILADIQAGLTDITKAAAIASREEAIRYAIMQAQPADIIVVAGKGHENYQIIGDKRIDFDDRVCVQLILQGE